VKALVYCDGLRQVFGQLAHCLKLGENTRLSMVSGAVVFTLLSAPYSLI